MGQDFAHLVMLLAGVGGKIACKVAHFAILLVCALGGRANLEILHRLHHLNHVRHLNHLCPLQVTQVVQAAQAVQAVQDCKISRLQSPPRSCTLEHPSERSKLACNLAPCTPLLKMSKNLADQD